MIEINVEDTTNCYVCGSKEKRNGCSLHVWDIEYECGCIIIGAISNKDIYVHVECPNLIK